MTYDALLPGGATRTGMVPDSVSDQVRSKFLDTEIVVPPLQWPISEEADEVACASAWRARSVNWAVCPRRLAGLRGVN